MARRWGAAILVVLLVVAGRSFLLRQLWFDEALTLLNFALLPGIGAIYRNYAIPNNQILYTMALHEVLPFAPDPWDFSLRLVSFAAAAGVLLWLYYRFRTRYGSLPLLIPLAALASGVPFLVYATALRGYMLGALFCVAALVAALGFARSPSWKNGAGYFAACTAAVGTIPTNLLALGAVVLYALPLCGAAFWRSRRAWFLALAPFAGLALFYAPIAPSFLAMLKLGEGWHDRCALVRAYAAVVIYVFGFLLFFAAASLLIRRRSRNRRMRWSRAAIWLLPLPVAFCLPTPPFPRVFFPLLPILALLTASGICDVAAWQVRLRRNVSRTWSCCILLGLTILGTAAGHTAALRLEFSRRNGGAGADDFFYSYYLRPEHDPRSTAKLVQKIGAEIPVCYYSFSADPWPLMYYLRITGAVPQTELFDGPRGRVPALPDGCIVILNRAESPQTVTDRFRGALELRGETAMHRVFIYRKSPTPDGENAAF